jgi:hypothetical protein
MPQLKKPQYVAIIILPLALVACSEKSKPQTNPHPKYFVTISGHINPKLSKPIYLGFWARYGAINPKCKVWINRLEGVKGMPAKTQFFKPSPNTKGDYAIKIPIDRYQSGMCDWKMAEVDMTASFKPINSDYSKNGWNWQVIVFGSPKEGLPGLPVNKNFTATLNSEQCHKVGFNMCGDMLSGTYSKVSIIQKNNYHFIQNII